MNVVDSSGWLEYFADSSNASYFSAVIQNQSELLVPAISIYEVFKRMLLQRGEDDALAAVATMVQGTVVDLDIAVAMAAARLSTELKLPMADSIILATSQLRGAILWTQDKHFAEMTGVEYIAKEEGDATHGTSQRHAGG